MHEMVQTIRAIARGEAAQTPAVELAVVSSLHGTPECACSVRLRESGVVLPHVPIATGLLGTASLPVEGDLVLVAFAGGDLHAPVVIGRLYSEATAPPEVAPGQLAAWLPHAETEAGSRIELLVDTPDDGSRTLDLTLAGDPAVSLHVDDGSIVLTAGKATLSLTQSGGSDGRASLEVDGSSVVIEQGGDVTIKASGTLTLKANQIELSGDTSVKVAGQTIDLN